MARQKRVKKKDVWNLNTTIADFVAAHLRAFKKLNCSYPCPVSLDTSEEPHYKKYPDGCNCEQEWDDILDKLIATFERLSDEWFAWHKDYGEVQEGLQLFVKYLPKLWV